jgi:predicted alpha/beta-fold hydrolase
MVHFIVRNMWHIAKEYLLKHKHTKFQRELVALGDGGTVALDWAYNFESKTKEYRPDAPIVILSHGMAGSSQSEYIVHLADDLMAAGYRVAALVARGCGGLRITGGSVVAGRKTSDIYECINLIHGRHPQSKIFLIGWSLGGALTLQYLADYNENSGLTAAISVSPPWNMNSNINSPSSSLFWSMLLSLPIKLFVIQHYAYLKKTNPDAKEITKWDILTASDVAQLDENCTTAYGESYGSMKRYYQNTAINPVASCHKIITPTLCLTAVDDPICTHMDCPVTSNDIGPGLCVVSHPTCTGTPFVRILILSGNISLAFYVTFSLQL